MRVTEQIDALRTMATHPVDHLVVPRVLATVISMPLLTVLAWVVGIFAAMVLASSLLGIESAFSLKHLYFYTDEEDVLMGVIKALVFGLLISLISCYRGLNCSNGAEGVGAPPTKQWCSRASRFWSPTFSSHSSCVRYCIRGND